MLGKGFALLLALQQSLSVVAQPLLGTQRVAGRHGAFAGIWGGSSFLVGNALFSCLEYLGDCHM